MYISYIYVWKVISLIPALPKGCNAGNKSPMGDDMDGSSSSEGTNLFLLELSGAKIPSVKHTLKIFPSACNSCDSEYLI